MQWLAARTIHARRTKARTIRTTIPVPSLDMIYFRTSVLFLFLVETTWCSAWYFVSSRNSCHLASRARTDFPKFISHATRALNSLAIDSQSSRVDRLPRNSVVIVSAVPTNKHTSRVLSKLNWRFDARCAALKITLNQAGELLFQRKREVIRVTAALLHTIHSILSLRLWQMTCPSRSPRT